MRGGPRLLCACVILAFSAACGAARGSAAASDERLPDELPSDDEAPARASSPVEDEAVSNEPVPDATAQSPATSDPLPLAIGHDPLEAVCPELRSTYDEEMDYAAHFPRAPGARALTALLEAAGESAHSIFDGGRCTSVLLAHEALISLACTYGDSDAGDAPHVIEVLNAAPGAHPGLVDLASQFEGSIGFPELIQRACLGQSSEDGEAAEELAARCRALRDDHGAYRSALGPRGILLVSDVDWDTGRPLAEGMLEIPYREVAAHVAPASALAAYLASCPAALAP